MATIKSSHIEQPINKFICLVKRSEVFNVFFQPTKWEVWNVLAETKEGAKKIAKYHFYRSKENEIFISNPIT